MAESVTLEVLSPESAVSTAKSPAPRLDGLEGKTICEVWATGDFRGDETFPAIRELLQRRFPTLTFVPHTDFPRGKKFPNMHWLPLEDVAAALRAKECDAILLGNGG